MLYCYLIDLIKKRRLLQYQNIANFTIIRNIQKKITFDLLYRNNYNLLLYV